MCGPCGSDPGAWCCTTLAAQWPVRSWELGRKVVIGRVCSVGWSGCIGELCACLRCGALVNVEYLRESHVAPAKKRFCFLVPGGGRGGADFIWWHVPAAMCLNHGMLL
eukprot:5360328-Prymnesium_polylepis.1